MAQTSRTVGKIGELTLGGGTNYQGSQIKNVTLDVEIATRDNSAVNDIWSWPKELRRSGRLTWNVAAEDSDALAILSDMCSGGTADGIAFVWAPYKDPGGEAISAVSPRLSGTLILTRGSQTGDEEGSRSFEALVQGAVVKA